MADDDIVAAAQREVKNALLSRLGNLVTSVWDFTLGFVVNFMFLRCNFDKLDQEKMPRLKELRDDVRNRATNEARQPDTCVTSQASGWMKRVEKLESEFNNFHNSFDRLSICSVDGFSLGQSVANMLRQVEVLTVEGNALQQQAALVAPRVSYAFERVPFEISSSSFVGDRRVLKQLQAHILDDRVGIIGIYGMGGIGKTTHLKIIHNEFLHEGARDKFDVAIWVTVSQQVDICRIQTDIGKRLNLSLLGGDDCHDASSHLITERASKLFRELTGKRFILFLDDVWEKLDIVNIVGIPLPKTENKNCKVLFTTRSEEVCNAMDADQKVEVSLLDDESSWNFFLSKVGSEVNVKDTEIRQLATEVVKRCGRLPISLITVGRAMAGASTPGVWRNAIKSLAELSGMDDVLASLKFSFDKLKNDRLRSCLLYCVLFPEDYNIFKGQLIDYWSCEGLLDDERCRDLPIDDTRDRGHEQIRQLQNACLLEKGNSNGEEGSVRLHDTVREMCLWITREKFLALAGDRSTRVPVIRTWEGLERISLMWNKSTTISEAPPPEVRFPNLTTLLLRFSSFERPIFNNFLKCMTALRVLDLFLTESLPKELPVAITSLVMLQYLNLLGAPIESLPKELGNLIHLRQLILDHTLSLKTIPREAITLLVRLQVLRMEGSGYIFGQNSELTLSDLENLRQLCELSLRVRSSHSLKMIAGSNLLRKCVKSLDVFSSNVRKVDNRVSVAIGDMPKLRRLSLADNIDNPSMVFHLCPHSNLEVLNLSGLSFFETTGMGEREIPFQRLKILYISNCRGLTDLSWVDQLPCLECFDVRTCPSLRVLLPHSDGGLSKLKDMELWDLPALTSISPCPLLFPSLERLVVMNCPLVKRLPFGPQSAKKLMRLDGEQAWWDELEESSVKSTFQARFRASN